MAQDASTTRPDIFQLSDYKVVLEHWLKSLPKQGHGLKQMMAEAAQCQSAYISLVLNGGAHFSLEQAQRIARLLEFSAREERYFLTLLQLNRAGTPELQKYFQAEVDQLRSENLSIQKRTGIQDKLSEADQATYYSSYKYAVAHVLTTVPGFQTGPAIARALKISLDEVRKILDFLESRGLLSQTGGKYQMGKTLLHLDKKSPLISKHHANWRLRAIDRIEAGDETGLHYSAAFTLSEEDFTSLREKLLKFIEEMVRTVSSSESKKLCAFSLDWFEPV